MKSGLHPLATSMDLRGWRGSVLGSGGRNNHMEQPAARKDDKRDSGLQRLSIDRTACGFEV